ncbi:uracil phosphoribosyltransferase-domain-containing protein [Mycena sanguinolenta]|nr:uracil phosphoribosyltransferase-domain-containing protein [Mycena sanguinolenta]
MPAPAKISQSTGSKAPMVIGLYGVPGCGKSYLLSLLKADSELGQEAFTFYEGSAIIDLLIPNGGLDAFKRMNMYDKTHWREQAISHIRDECAASGKIGLVAGHFMFWEDEAEGAEERVWTDRDAGVFTHIIYLAVPFAEVARRRASDSNRRRAAVLEEHIGKWQEAEREGLRTICLEKKILFTLAPPLAVSSLIRALVQRKTEDYNFSCAHATLDGIVAGFRDDKMRRDAMLVFDGDKTLVAEDTGKIFWEIAMAEADVDTASLAGKGDPMKQLFSSPFGYSYDAFLQAAFIYEALDAAKFDSYCAQAAASVHIHPELISLLKSAAERRVGAVIITCGLRLLWEKILHAVGLSQWVKVVGAGRIQDERAVVVTARVKRELVMRLRDVHETCVCAFGDSRLDLPMLKEAERAVVVVGQEHARSRSMEAVLRDAIVNDGLRAEQWLLPSCATPRLDIQQLPLFEFGSGPTFIDSLAHLFALRRRVLHATDEHATKLLMTPMRDARLSGPPLQDAHSSAGWYLATTFLPKLVGGLEEIEVPHVQGHKTTGHRLRNEKKTVIVALMRGGEPMAVGVYRAMPLAMFVHAKKPEELTIEHVEGRESILLVDSVVNSGQSVDEFVTHIRKNLDSTVRIVVIAGVIQAQSLADGILGDILTRDDNVGVVALRVSENKYTGKGTTDTGNRLFNSTHLD